MGINGLLPLLKSIHKPCNLKKFEGKTLGVDAYGWLHRGTVACAMELATGKPTRKFVDFAMHRVRMLQHFGVTPYLVFDGDYLPSKAATEMDRAKRREESRKNGFELLNAGKTSQAFLEFQKAIDVSPEMARQLIDELKHTGVKYIVAPYEADAQMVYLERKGLIDGIISEDSDLLVFGAKCLLTKLDQYGNCIEVNKADFCACREMNLTGWSDTEFRSMAILSGCDYLASISNMGLKTAYRMVRKHKTIEKVVRMLQFDGKFHVPKGYLEAFRQAEWTFLHQRVFCPQSRSIVFHTEPQSQLDLANMPYIGSFIEPGIAQGVARGDLNPMTKMPIVATRRQRTSENELKKGVSIDRFFKAKRVPLGELDPNSFTPSPSQQETLQRNSGPWLSSPIQVQLPRHYLPSTTEPNTSRSAPPSQILQHTLRASNLSEPRPLKRARLCADDDRLASPSKKIEQSRFFSTSALDPSPSVGRLGKSRRSKKQDFSILSDESVECNVQYLPDVEGFASAMTEKMNVFVEGSQSRIQIEDVSTACGTYEKQHEASSSLSSSEHTITPAEQPSTPLQSIPASKGVPGGNCPKLRGAIITPKSCSPPQILPSTVSASMKPSKIPVAIYKKATPRTTSATKSRLTPLQRLGASATNRTSQIMTPPETPVYAPVTGLYRRSLLSRTGVPFPEVARENHQKIVEPASVPLPQPDDNENHALNTDVGSEDLIIRDSEGEDEALSPRQDCASNPRIDLGRFAYSGRV